MTVYGEYARTSNLAAVGVYMVTLIAAQAAQIGESPHESCTRRRYGLRETCMHILMSVTCPFRVSVREPKSPHVLIRIEPADTDSLLLAGNFWLKQWAERNTEEGANPEVGKYIGIYFLFGVGSAALTATQTLILWIFCSIEVCADASRRKFGL